MSDRGTIERLNDGALVRCRQAFAKGKMPSSGADLALALESEHITIDELEHIEALVGDPTDMGIG